MKYFAQYNDSGTLIAIGTGIGGTEIIESEYNRLLAEIRDKASLVNQLYNGEITIAEVPEDWRDEIQRRVTERQEAEAEPDPEQSEMDDMAAALTLLGVTPEEE